MLSVAEVIQHFLGHGEESLDVVVDAICLEVLECDADFVAVIGFTFALSDINYKKSISDSA